VGRRVVDHNRLRREIRYAGRIVPVGLLSLRTPKLDAPTTFKTGMSDREIIRFGVPHFHVVVGERRSGIIHNWDSCDHKEVIEVPDPGWEWRLAANAVPARSLMANKRPPCCSCFFTFSFEIGFAGPCSGAARPAKLGAHLFVLGEEKIKV
jgi:hypothetical protein